MIGMDASTGRSLGTLDHIRQSIGDILSTPIGTRVMRREYGSLLPYLVDAPMDRATVIDIIQASAGAIARWEPRVRVLRIDPQLDDAASGRLALTLDVMLMDTAPRAMVDVVIGQGGDA
jgi:phage baseplate assembly protein W